MEPCSPDGAPAESGACQGQDCSKHLPVCSTGASITVRGTACATDGSAVRTLATSLTAVSVTLRRGTHDGRTNNDRTSRARKMPGCQSNSTVTRPPVCLATPACSAATPGGRRSTFGCLSPTRARSRSPMSAWTMSKCCSCRTSSPPVTRRRRPAGSRRAMWSRCGGRALWDSSPCRAR